MEDNGNDEQKTTDISPAGGELSTTLNYLAQTFQKLADTAQRGYRDETMPIGLQRELKGKWASFTTAAETCRDVEKRVKMKKPLVGVDLFVQLFKTAMDASRQNE